MHAGCVRQCRRTVKRSLPSAKAMVAFIALVCYWAWAGFRAVMHSMRKA